MNAMSPIPVPERVKVIMSMISNAAEHGDEFPTNFFLANASGTSTKTVLGVIGLLETMNVIKVERGRNWRIATIVATGKSTRRPSMCRNPSGPSADVRAASKVKQDANRRIRIGLFGDALSEGASIKEAGIIAGVSEPTAHSMMRTIRAELGWQAQ